jgi:diguanylate cyclase (GGDEF)-like protein
MRIIFRPAELLLGRLVFVQKFILLVLVLVVPFGIVVFAYARQQSATISSSEVERQGTQVIEPLIRLGQDLTAARHAAVVTGRTVAVPAADVAAVDRTQRRYGAMLHTAAEWSEVRQQILLAGTTNGHATALAAYDGVSIGLQNLLVDVGDVSRLSVDPDLPVSDLFDSIDVRLPTLIETSTRIVDQLIADASNGVGRAEKVTLLSQVGIALGVIDNTASSLDQSFGDASEGSRDPVLARLLPARLKALDDSVSRLDATLRNATITSRGVARNREAAEPVVRAAQALNLAATAAMDRQLEKRIALYTRRAHRVELLAAITTLIAIYLFGGFYVFVAGAIRRMVMTLRAFARGRVTEEIPVTSRDELGYVAAAINDMVSKVRRATAKLAHDAWHDGLTGLPNRSRVIELLSHDLPKVTMEDGLALLFVDLDGFKPVNDTLGHAAGDAVLAAVAPRLAGVTRAGDTVARLSGDEFLVVAHGLSDVEAAVEVAERMLTALRSPITVMASAGEARQVRVGASVGVVYTTDPRVDADVLIADADVAMYRAKELGRGRVEVFDETLRVAVKDSQRARDELRDAIAAGEIEVHYQPIVETCSGAVRGFEALARWAHPERGLLGPGVFMPTAESSGLIVVLGAQVLRDACRQLAIWQRDPAMAPDLHMAVNVSTRQLVDHEIVEVVTGAVADAGIDPGDLWLEITESALLTDVETARDVLVTLRKAGVRLVVDDFGTGYSSLQHLKMFPLDAIKIDRGFVAGIGEDAGDEAIVRSVIGLASALGFQIVAEGVETQDQQLWLLERECRLAQGFLFSRPRPPAAFSGTGTVVDESEGEPSAPPVARASAGAV